MKTDFQIFCAIWGLAVVWFSSGSVFGQILQVIEVGDNASINCFNASHQANLSLFPNKGLKGSVVWRRKTKIQDRYWIDVYNNRSTISLQNVSTDASGFYGCFYNNASDPVKVTQLKIGYAPQAPYDVSCETNGQLTYMLCCWKAGRETNLNTTYIVEYTASRSASNLIQQQTTFQNRSYCEQTRSTFERPICCSIVLSPITEPDLNSHGVLPVYVLQVNASNKLGNAISLPSNEIPHMWVTPNPPKNVRISQHGRTANHRSTSLLVQWNKPHVDRLVALVYKLRYRASAYADTWHTIDDITETSHVIINLRSGSNYQVQVAAKPNGVQFNGFWSDWSNITSSDTDHNVPTSKFHFESVQGILSNELTSCYLRLRWRPYARTGEPGFHYKLVITYGGNSVKKLETHKTNLQIDIDLNLTIAEIRVQGQFCNDIGCSVSDQRSLSVQKEWQPIANVKILLDNNQKSVSWDPPMNVCGDHTCIVQICATPRSGNTFNEIFGESNSTTVATSRENCENIAAKTLCASGTISVFGFSDSPCNIYTAKVLRRCSTSASEEILIDSQPGNQVLQNPVFSEIQFELTDAGTTNLLNEIDLVWKDGIECSVKNEALKLFAIYTSISGAECNYTKCVQKRNIKKIRDCLKHKQVITDDVYGGTEYNVGLGYCCEDTNTNPRLPFCFPASSSQRVTLSDGAPGVPLHLTWTVQTTINVNWSPSQHKNGHLDGYIFSYGTTSKHNPSFFSSYITTATSYSIPNSCSAGDDASYWVSVSGYNFGIDGKKLVGASANLSNVTCITEVSTPSNMAAMFVGLAISLAVICCCLIAGHYHRKRIKQAIRKSIWPPVPDPMLLVSFRADTNEDVDSPHQPRDANGNVHFDIARENSVENADDIYETKATCSATRGNPPARSAQNRPSQCEEAEKVHLLESNHDADLPTRSSLAHADSGLSSLRSSNPRRSSRNKSSTTRRHRHNSDSNLTEYSTISPMSPLLSLGSGNSTLDPCPDASVAFHSRPTSWTSISARISIPRPVGRAALSCSDNSLSYVRYCQRDGMERNNFSSPLHANEEWQNGNTPGILYTKLAAVSHHSSSTSTDDALSRPDDLSLTSRTRPPAPIRDQMGSSPSLSDYVGRVDPYVTAPESNPLLLERSMSSEPHARDSCEGSQDSIDRLYTSVRQGANPTATDAEEETVAPLLNEYVTMDQALEMGDESPSPTDENLSVTAASNLAVAGDLDEILGQVPNHYCGDSSLADDDERHNNLPSTSAPSDLDYISVAEATQFAAPTP
uniref:Class I cytokine receptor glycoprotein 130-like n=1 Tax=Phallusia mammillata TaxID=59560 RepID=A0A6F9DEF1_9ASCI|nr:class I cytokine receptor glycoprotein 130-like [Phallusia mammillata]